MKRVLAMAASVFVLAAASVAAAQVTSNQNVSVTPASGRTGTTFTISFVTPSAAGKRAYHVHGSVPNAAQKLDQCQPTFDFFNPKKVAANSRVKFTFKVTADQGMCTGRWTVTVRRNGTRILRAGHFTLR